MPPLAGSCDYTPKANALNAKIKLQKIELKGLPSAGSTDRGGGYSAGVTEAKFFPGSATDFFIMRKVGAVYHYKLDAAEGNSATLVKALTIPNVRSGGDTGLLALAFDPQFATNKFVYFGYAVNGGGRSSVITRFTYENNELTNPQRIIDFTTQSSGALYHSIGSIGFDKDGALWALHGDWDMKGASESQNLNSLLGKLVRIIPSRAPMAGGWEPAPGNPFMGDPKPKSAIYAYGLRSPWRGGVNAKGHYIIGDIGPNVNEEVNFVTSANANLGWGPSNQTCGNVSQLCYRGGIPGFDGGNFEERNGRSVWVGPQYGDCGKDRYGGALTGIYLFGDFFAGWFGGMQIGDDGKKVKQAQLATQAVITSVDQNVDGYVYVTKFGVYSHEGATDPDQGIYRVMLQ